VQNDEERKKRGQARTREEELREQDTETRGEREEREKRGKNEQNNRE
jgi:hypothetical protein